MRRAAVAALAAAMTVGTVSAVGAQAPAPSLRPHRLTLAGGVSWAGGYPIGEQTATLRPNQPGAGGTFTLFEARSSFGRATGVEARLGFTLTPTLAVELGGAYAGPRIAVAISGDPEAPSTVLEGEAIEQYVIDIGLVWQPPGLRVGRRGAPYLTGGGGYLRQLYPGRSRVEHGQLYHVGAGLRYWLRGAAGQGRALGLRADVRANIRRGGIEFAARTRVYPAVSLLAFVAF